MSTSAQSSSQNSDSIGSSNGPYFLHHSDSPGTVLVLQILTGENYGAWSRAMTIALFVKNKIDFIEGTIPQPLATDVDRFKSWNRSNNIVISWILNSISKEITASVIYLKTAKDILERVEGKVSIEQYSKDFSYQM